MLFVICLTRPGMAAGVAWLLLILTSSASAFGHGSQSAFAVRGALLGAASYGNGRRATARSHVRSSGVERQAMQMSWWDDLFSVKKPGKTEKREVVIVGAGVSGLICAKKLQAEGKDVIVVEQSDGVGGRVRTDRYKGFLLDRGFQVFIEAYPKVKQSLDYEALDLQSFWPGALVRADGGFHTVADPFRRPQDSLKGLLAPVGSLADKARVALLRIQATQTPLDKIFEEKETDTESFLRRDKGFGPKMVDRFFRPFYQGIFLAPLSEQSSRMFGFVFKMFAEGGISLPRGGIGALSDQLASNLKPGSVRLNSGVKAVRPGRVELRNGDVLEARAIVVATDEPSTASLLGPRLLVGPPGPTTKNPVKGRGSTCLYYATPNAPPIAEPLLILNGEGTSPQAPVNNVVFLSSINRDYAPPGQTLVSATVVGIPALNDAALDACVRKQLSTWFGDKEVQGWEFLRTYRVPYAQPAQTPPTGPSFVKPSALGDGLFVCGDFRNTATLNGAFESGELAAGEVLSFLASSPQKNAKPAKPSVATAGQ